MEYERRNISPYIDPSCFARMQKPTLVGMTGGGIRKFLVIFLVGVETMLNASLIRSQEALEGS